MNCKRGEILIALQLPKRESKLPGDLGGDRRLVLAVIVREPVFRHSERSKQQIPEGKSAGKVGVATLLQRGVMPAVKNWARQHVLGTTEGPVEICMDECRVEGLEGPYPEHLIGRYPGHQQHNVHHDGAQEQVGGMEARSRNPVQLLRGMIDSVVFPKSAAMKHAMEPVQHEIGRDDEKHSL